MTDDELIWKFREATQAYSLVADRNTITNYVDAAGKAYVAGLFNDRQYAHVLLDVLRPVIGR